jgi:hypothetical protein
MKLYVSLNYQCVYFEGNCVRLFNDGVLKYHGYFGGEFYVISNDLLHFYDAIKTFINKL